MFNMIYLDAFCGLQVTSSIPHFAVFSNDDEGYVLIASDAGDARSDGAEDFAGDGSSPAGRPQCKLRAALCEGPHPEPDNHYRRHVFIPSAMESAQANGAMLLSPTRWTCLHDKKCMDWGFCICSSCLG